MSSRNEEARWLEGDHPIVERDRRGDGVRVDPEEIERQRVKGWPDFHPEAYCHRCGTRNVWSWSTDDDVFSEATGDSGTILCPQCLAAFYPDQTWAFLPLDRVDALRAALGREIANSDRLATELDRWGRGDFRFGDQPRDEGVVAALAAHVGVVEQRP